MEYNLFSCEHEDCFNQILGGFYYKGNYYACAKVKSDVEMGIPSSCHRTFVDSGGGAASIVSAV